MSKAMTMERATEFGSAWNSRDPDLVTSFFADDGVYHASVGPDRLGKTYRGKEEIRKGVRAFFDRFPDGRFENLKWRKPRAGGNDESSMPRLLHTPSGASPDP